MENNSKDKEAIEVLTLRIDLAVCLLELLGGQRATPFSVLRPPATLPPSFSPRTILTQFTLYLTYLSK